MNDRVIVIGAGGHARVVAEALRLSGTDVLGFTDVNASLHGSELDGHRVLGSDAVLSSYAGSGVLLANGVGSIGVPQARQALQERLRRHGWRFINVIHARAVVSPRAELAEGVQVMAGALVQAGARLAQGCIVNTGAIVDHDCALGPYCHVASGAVLAGGVILGEACHVGAGAVIIEGIELGTKTVVGAGAVVVRSHAGGATLVGVPARARVRS